MTELEKRLTARVRLLENQLVSLGFPCDERSCECCGKMYLPEHYESCRCNLCCLTCFRPRGAKDWVHGHACPLNKEKQDVSV